MLVETTQSYASVEDTQDALTGIKNIPGFVLGYVVPGNPKTRLVFLYHCANGDAGRTQKVVDSHATKDGSHLEQLRSTLLPFAEMDRENGDLNEVACQRGTASDLTILTSGDFRRAAVVFRETDPQNVDPARL
jgi:hypothetical protein